MWTGGSSMESAWIINFKDGYRVLLSEEKYITHNKTTDQTKILYEEHWFSMDAAKAKNPDIFIIE